VRLDFRKGVDGKRLLSSRRAGGSS